MSSIFIYPPTNGQGGGGGTGDVTVIDNLTSTSSTDALSAFQGNVLDKKITAQSDTFDLKLTEQFNTINNTINEKVTELNTKIEEQSLKIASTTQLGNVKIDGDSIKIRPDGTIYIENVASNAIFEIHELILPTTQIGQSEWIIPNEYYKSGDTLIVSHNSTVLDSTMYTLTEVGGVVKVIIQNTNDLPIDKNNVYVVIFHNKIPDPQFTIYDKVLLTDTLSQKTWTIDTPNFDSTKDSVLVIYNTTLLSNNEYTIVGDKLTLLVDTAEAIDKNTVSVFVFSNSRPLGGNYTLPIATTSILGGIKPDGVTLTVDPSTGIATVVGGGNINLPISANDITETANRQFIDGTLKAQITSNSSTLNNQELRLSNVESTIANSSTTDEKVKLNALGTSGYLEDFIDNSTISISNNKLVVNGIKDVVATIQEINNLQGVNGNIQAQINSLSSIGNFSTTIMNYSQLSDILNPKPQDMVIVLSDETHMDKSTIYIYNGTQWIYSGDFKGGEVRDFTTKPINLSTETEGVLQKSKYEKQNASETTIVDTNNNFTATNVEDALSELFQYVNSGKNGVATSIGYPLNSSDNFSQMVQKINNLKNSFAQNNTLKGVTTYSYEPLSQMIDKVLSIPNIELSGTVKKKSKINITSPYLLEIILNDYLSLSDITSTLFEFVQGEVGVVHYNLDFNNGDSSNFLDNKYVNFDGVMSLLKQKNYNMYNYQPWSDIGLVRYSENIADNNYTVDKLNLINKNSTAKLNSNRKGSNITLSNGDLTAYIPTRQSVFATESKSKGKWYWEVTYDMETGTDSKLTIGIGNDSATVSDSWSYPNSGGYYGQDGRVYGITGNGNSAYGSPFKVGDTIGVLLDVDNKTISFSKNGIVQSAISFIITGTNFYPSLSRGSTSGSITATINFGQSEFKYQIPDGYSPYSVDKTISLIYHDNYYKSYNKDTDEWRIIGNALEGSQTFINNGMSEISNLLSRVNGYSPLDKLNGDYSLYVWNEDIYSDISLNADISVKDQLVYAKSDISLVGVESISSISLNSYGNSKVAISFDSGMNYYAYKNNQWQLIQSAEEGMTSTEINTLTSETIESLRLNSNVLRFSYYLNGDSYIDNIKVSVNMQGYEKIADTKDYTLSYDQAQKKLIYNITKSGTYSVNYVDGSTQV